MPALTARTRVIPLEKRDVLDTSPIIERASSLRLGDFDGDPTGIRTRVTGVRGRRPEPLDDGTLY